MPRPSPPVSIIARGFDRLVRWSTGLSREQAWVGTLGSMTVLALLSVLAGQHYTFAALSIVPMALAAWTLGSPAGFAVGAANAGVAVWVNGVGPAFAPHHREIETFAAIWNLGMRAFSVFVIVMLVAGFRRTFDLERWRARHDALTGALNKRAFLASVGSMSAAAAREGCTVVLAYLDLDGFKQVNDRHGHAAGDEVLRLFAEGATKLMRAGDCFARFGGDEFVLMANAADRDDGLKAAERIHARLTALLAGLPYAVSCSTGAVVVEPGAVDSPGELIAAADALMYEVKRAGRGALRIAVASAQRGARAKAELGLAA